MNVCKICGESAPEGKERCWICEHTHRLPQTVQKAERTAENIVDKDIDVPADGECEMCRIPAPGEVEK